MERSRVEVSAEEVSCLAPGILAGIGEVSGYVTKGARASLEVFQGV